MSDLFESAKLYSVGEVSDLLRVSPATVTRAIRGGRLKAMRVGGQWRIRGSDALAYVEQETNRALDREAASPD
ncbi:MAG: helix-turn-helix domain-containing protein [Chloroflexi bacterium]|nr:helix-turn-helix domain-containing protein [Chloroflexota bacterium]